MLEVVDWGLLGYSEALERQEQWVAQIAADTRPETLVVVRHPEVVTIGRRAESAEWREWTGSVAKVNRGGRATYHGPGQIVLYPLIRLDRRAKDVHGFLRLLETATVQTLRNWGLDAVGSPAEMKTEGIEPTGVWVGSKKLASLGIAIRKWVTFHGLALNADQDQSSTSSIWACGYVPGTMTSVEALLGSVDYRAKGGREGLSGDLVSEVRRGLGQFGLA